MAVKSYHPETLAAEEEKKKNKIKNSDKPIIVGALREPIRIYCADLSTSVKFDTEVDQSILIYFFEGAILAKSKMATTRYFIFHNYITKGHKNMSKGTFYMYLTSRIPNLQSVLTYNM